MSLSLAFDNTYACLPEQFFTRVAPTPVKLPKLITVNEDLSRELGLDPELLRSPEGTAMLAGNSVPESADPLAQAYAGHQFGGWNPKLGDGRAILIGELLDINGVRHDLQLKGSGRTPYSRMGDGRAWLGPVLREYIVSEAMYALGIPTTRALAAVETGEIVQRERALPGAVLTRVASSHIRVGTFQYFASRQDVDAVQALTDFVIKRHYPDANNALDLLNAVIARHAKLIAAWMGVGFIHGVMNTDNSHIAGDTIDYGPCAFMDGYHPATVYSSIDQFGRYAYGKQPEIAVWNLAQLATSLLPLIDDDRDKGVELATAAVHSFPDLYQAEWLRIFRGKLGLTDTDDGDQSLIDGLLALMTRDGADFTNTFRGLSNGSAASQFKDPKSFVAWTKLWQARGPDTNLVLRNNPAVIPRNHRIEQLIQAAITGDYAPFFTLLRILKSPFSLADADLDFADPPKPTEVVQATFCGT